MVRKLFIEKDCRHYHSAKLRGCAKGFLLPKQFSAGKAEVDLVLQLDPSDKSWEIEVMEKRAAYLKIAGKSWRFGARTRVWRPRRTTED